MILMVGLISASSNVACAQNKSTFRIAKGLLNVFLNILWDKLRCGGYWRDGGRVSEYKFMCFVVDYGEVGKLQNIMVVL